MWMFLLGVIAAAYFYFGNPFGTASVVERTGCWMKQGSYVRFTDEEPDYREMMAQNPINRVRLQSGVARGCLPEGACMETPEEAERVLRRKIMLWQVAEMRDALGSRIIGAMANGLKNQIDIDMPEFAFMEAGIMEAKRLESVFCQNKLESARAELPLAHLIDQAAAEMNDSK